MVSFIELWISTRSKRFCSNHIYQNLPFVSDCILVMCTRYIWGAPHVFFASNTRSDTNTCIEFIPMQSERLHCDTLGVQVRTVRTRCNRRTTRRSEKCTAYFRRPRCKDWLRLQTSAKAEQISEDLNFQESKRLHILCSATQKLNIFEELNSCRVVLSLGPTEKNFRPLKLSRSAYEKKSAMRC